MPASLLSVCDLRTHLDTKRGVVRAVEGVSLDIQAGEVLGVVGESGCGKTMTALSIMRLIPRSVGRIAGGSVRLAGTDLLALSEDEMRRWRGRQLSMIFQDPLTSLNPTMKVGRQIAEALEVHLNLSARAARSRAIDWLERVGIADPEKSAGRYPYQLSGGMRQRVMIAMALCCGPRLLLADEPTTALDVTIQAQIIELLRDLTRESGTAVMLITHDLGIVAGFCQRVAVMYAGRVVETGETRALFHSPAHPYLRGLMRSLPTLKKDRSERLVPIRGMPPSLARQFVGCPFAPRCDIQIAECLLYVPPLRAVSDGHAAACIRATERAPA